MATDQVRSFVVVVSHVTWGFVVFVEKNNKYSGTSENGLPLLRKPPQCGQESTVPNYSLYFSVCT